MIRCNCEPLRPWQRVQLHRPGSRGPGRLPRHGLSILPLWPQYALPALLAGPRVDIPMCRPRPLGGLPSRLLGRRPPCRPALVLLSPVLPLRREDADLKNAGDLRQPRLPLRVGEAAASLDIASMICFFRCGNDNVAKCILACNPVEDYKLLTLDTSI